MNEEVMKHATKLNKLIHLLGGEHTIRSPNGRQARCKPILRKDQQLQLIEELAVAFKILEQESNVEDRIDCIFDSILDKIMFVIPPSPRGHRVDEIYTKSKGPSVIKANFTHWFVEYYMTQE